MGSDLRQTILLEALKEIPLNGVSDATLRNAGKNAGASVSELRRLYPRGAESLVEAFSQWADRCMEERYKAAKVERVRDRITFAVRARIEAVAHQKEATRRVTAFLALPANAVLATKLLFATVDAMWLVAGDRSSDFNYYTKRALLAGVYATTLLYWLTDSSEGNTQSWSFLDARIANVMQIQKARSKFELAAAQFPNPFGILAALRATRTR